MIGTEFAELLEAAETASPQSRSEKLRVVRDCFVANAVQLSEADVARFDEIMRRLLDSAPLLDRVTFAKAVARSPRLPQHMRQRLLADNRMVAGPIMEHAAMEDPELAQIVQSGNESACVAIAKRAPLSGVVSDKLIGTGHLRVMMTLAENTKAEISPSGFEIMSDLAISNKGMDKALAARPDLPPAIAGKLIRALERRTSQRVSDIIEQDRVRARRPLILR